MAFTVNVRMKKLGKNRPGSVAPVPFIIENRPETVRELLEALVALGVRDYNSRKDDGRLLPFLTKEEITAQAGRGKVSFGLHGGGDACEADAAANALQCFEDGIYRVFADETELTALDERIPWTENTILTFIRLTMLSGW